MTSVLKHMCDEQPQASKLDIFVSYGGIKLYVQGEGKPSVHMIPMCPYCGMKFATMRDELLVRLMNDDYEQWVAETNNDEVMESR